MPVIHLARSAGGDALFGFISSVAFATILAVVFGLTLSGAIAASSNFPVLLLSMYWKGLTTLGVAVGGWLGLLTALVLTVLSPSIWHDVLGYPAGLFPYNSPAMFSMPLAFIACYVVSIMDRRAQSRIEAEKFEAQYIRSQTGIGAEGTAAH